MDTEQIKELYEKHFNTLYKICFLYMKNEADSLDAVQETFVRLIRSGFVGETEEKTKAWLIVTASNYCKKQLTNWWKKKRLPMEEEEYRLVQTPEREHDSLTGLVWSLPEKYRLPIFLYYYEGYRTKEIAQMLHSNASTIQTRLAKARKMLKIELTDFDDSLHSEMDYRQERCL